MIETQGEGNSKKAAKKNAAVQMLAIMKEKYEPLLILTAKSLELKELNSDSASVGDEDQEKKKHRKTKAKNIIKAKKANPEYGKGSINPISRLIQIQQAKKEPEPIFELASSEPLRPNSSKFTSHLRRKSEFVMQVRLDGATPGEQKIRCEGRGPTKKIAKQRAAESMLAMLGYQAKSAPLKPSIKSEVVATSNDKNEKKVKFVDESEAKVKVQGK